jgi:hypothetical protein
LWQWSQAGYLLYFWHFSKTPSMFSSLAMYSVHT